MPFEDRIVVITIVLQAKAARNVVGTLIGWQAIDGSRENAFKRKRGRTLVTLHNSKLNIANFSTRGYFQIRLKAYKRTEVG